MSGRSTGGDVDSDDHDNDQEEFASKVMELLGVPGAALSGQGESDTEEVHAGEQESTTDEEKDEIDAPLEEKLNALMRGIESPRLAACVERFVPGGVSALFGNGSGDAQGIFSQNEEEESDAPPAHELEVIKENGSHAHVLDVDESFQMEGGSDFGAVGGTAELGMLMHGCVSGQEAVSAGREMSDASKDIPGFGSTIGGDGDVASSLKSDVGDCMSNRNGESPVPVEMATTFGVGRERAKEAASPNSPNSGGVGVAPRSEEKKKKQGTFTPGAPQQYPAPDEARDPTKIHLPSLVGNKGNRAGTPRSFSPLALKTAGTPSLSKSASSPSKSPYSPSSSTGKAHVPRIRSVQTARSSRPEDDSPLAASGLALGLTTKTNRTPDFARLLKSTASSSAKNTVGSPTKPSPSKSLGDNRLRKSISMMGDAGSSGSGGSPAPTMAVGGSGSGEPGGSSLKEQFTAFSKFGDATSDGKQITLSNADKWMKQAHVIDGKKITTTDTSITFKKLFKTAKKVGLDDFKRYVEDLAKSKGMEGKDVLEKLANCGPPGHSSATKAAHAGVVSRLTDTTKYTGSHKERFDAAGKGKGIEGRRDVQDNSGYVAAFKAKQEASPTPK